MLTFMSSCKVVIMDSGENQNYHVNQARFISPLLKPMHLSKKKKKIMENTLVANWENSDKLWIQIKKH